ncbi:5'-3' exonuclease H3TH domain-containing protein [Aneurinibacillus thermoaerophilus]|uniref:5'-3' exonuclease n=1 Tax=Aneurinibacillus thermoaerophilus TaxID=143495 RepID=UPI002E239215|nr:5'-3' exonuclease H3TH domain-containing protein [Aneurinibacillus thermoaerophilus]MED0675273.1 5'-3' exonuclease H3TH domain-containing protein [Aneurinibacillus thermoaerophilus]
MVAKTGALIEKANKEAGVYRVAISPYPSVTTMIVSLESLLLQLDKEMPFSVVKSVEIEGEKNKFLVVRVDSISLEAEALREGTIQYRNHYIEYLLQSGISVDAFMESVKKFIRMLGKLMTQEKQYEIKEWTYNNGVFKIHTLPFQPIHVQKPSLVKNTVPDSRPEVLLLIDGPNMLSHAYYGTRSKPLNTSAGIPTNGVHCFVEKFFRYMRNIQPRPTHVAVLWDSEREHTFRRERYPEYKATRSPKPEDLEIQFDLMKDLLKDMNVPQFTVRGYEADDAIHTLAKRWTQEKNAPCYIISNDRDLFQLIDKNTKIIGKWKESEEVLGLEQFTERYGIEPSRWADVKGLVGDTSDNLPGCKGVGEKKVYDMIREYGGLDEIFASVDKISQSPSFKRYAKPLRQGKEEAMLTKELATLVNVPGLLKRDFSELELLLSKEGMIRGFERLEFKKFLENMKR